MAPFFPSNVPITCYTRHHSKVWLCPSVCPKKQERHRSCHRLSVAHSSYVILFQNVRRVLLPLHSNPIPCHTTAHHRALVAYFWYGHTCHGPACWSQTPLLRLCDVISFRYVNGDQSGYYTQGRRNNTSAYNADVIGPFRILVRITCSIVSQLKL